MNILHLVDEPYDSGIVHYALTLAKGLQNRGHSVSVGGLANRFPLQEAARMGLETFPVRRMPAGLFDLIRIIRRKRIEIINAHTGSSHTLAVAAAAMSKTPLRIVRTRADSQPVRLGFVAGSLWRRTAGFIAPTDRILGQFKRAYPKSRITAQTVLPGLPIASPDGHYREPPAPPYRVGILGRLDPVKGHASFLRAAALVHGEMPDTLFSIAGREENTKVRRLERLAATLGIRDSVRFLGHVPDARRFMRECHVGVIASSGSEAVSRAAIEWMSVGRPIVATNVGSLPEIVQDGKTGFLVSPGLNKSMARGILSLLQSRQVRELMGRNAFQRFETQFPLKRFVEDTEAFYEATIRDLSPR